MYSGLKRVQTQKQSGEFVCEGSASFKQLKTVQMLLSKLLRQKCGVI